LIRVANAPCSWGVLEFHDAAPPRIPPRKMLCEMAATGYAGTELGDWGFLPTDPATLSAAVAEHGLSLVGAFVPVRLADPSALAAATGCVLRVARLLAEASPHPAPNTQRAAPFVVLSDDNATVPHRTARAGRIAPGDGLGPDAWPGFVARAEQIATAVRDATGLRTAFHPHCAGYVETPSELDALMQRTDPDVLGLCLDTGHLTYGGGDPVAAIRRYGDRIRHVHLKDGSAEVMRRARAEAWDYRRAVREGLFCELGRGSVDFPAILDELRRAEYDGWLVVEQDIVAGLGTPAESAARNRAFLRALGV